MEAVMMHGALDQPISPYKIHLRNPKIFNQNQIQNPLLSNPSVDALWLSYYLNSARLPPPPFLSQSYPPFQSSQPPLLPLPYVAQRRSASSARGGRISSNSTPSFPAKKSKSKSKSPKKSPRKSKDAAVEALPLRKCEDRKGAAADGGDIGGVFSGSAVFTTVSPPPSSLPLPTFSMRPRLGCKAEASAGVDAGATDDLRRLLRLR